MRRTLTGTTALAVAATVATAIAVPGAPAQTTVTGTFGGGAVVGKNRPTNGPGNMTIGLRATGGRVQLNVSLRGSCGGGSTVVAVPVEADGSFRATGTKRLSSGGVRTRLVYDIPGSFSGDTASGTAKGSVALSGATRTRRCSIGTVRWNARRATGELGEFTGTRPAMLWGTTTAKRGGVKGGIVLRLDADGIRIERALYNADLRCRNSTLRGTDSPSPSLLFRSGGTFKDTEIFTFDDGNRRFRNVERLSGQIGTTGGKGSYSITTRVTNIRTGKLIETCTVPTTSWVAAG
jgi:hypothetical protein